MKVSGRQNRLISAVTRDIKNTDILVACRALGLVDKVLTGPLWRKIEAKGVSILELSETYTKVYYQLKEWEKDSSDIVSGMASLFHDVQSELEQAKLISIVRTDTPKRAKFETEKN